MRTMGAGRRKQRMNPSPTVVQVAGDLALRVYDGGGGTVAFTAPSTGVYRFYVWGGGGSFNIFDYRPESNVYAPSGGSCALSRYDRAMVKGETATVVAGQGGADSTVTFADGHIVRGGKGGNASDGGFASPLGGLGGIAVGGDININGTEGGGRINQGPGGGTDGGSPGTNTNITTSIYYGGPGAPGLDGLQGGNGGNSQGVPAQVPGGGGAYNSAAAAGRIIVVQRS